MSHFAFKSLSLLYVEDDPLIRERIHDVLTTLFGDIAMASDGQEALELFLTHTFHIVITDIEMPKMNGFELIEQIRTHDRHIPIIITTAYINESYLLKAIPLRLIEFIPKPFSFESLRKALLSALEHLKEEGQLHTPLSKSLSYDRIRKVLIEGESITRLTKREIALLELLLKNRRALITPEQISLEVYNTQTATTDAIRNLIFRLRKKVGKEMLITVKDEGFFLK